MSQGSEFVKHHRSSGAPLREGLPPLPARMSHLPRDHRGYPVPWFVAFVDGKPDFRVIRQHGIATAYSKKICWLCGQPLGVNLAFVIGPMCAVNRVTSEPASHTDCAMFAAQACPFLIHPAAKRRESNIPENSSAAAGLGHPRNPGGALVWVSSNYRPFKVPTGGYLFNVGAPHKLDDGGLSVFWFKEGKPATRAEAYQILRAGMPILIEAAQLDGPPAIEALTRQYQAALFLLPAGDPIPGLDTDPAPAPVIVDPSAPSPG